MSFYQFEKQLEKNSFRYADKVSIGDDIVVQENKDLSPAKVVNVWSQVMRGDHCFFNIFLCALGFPYVLLILNISQFANIVVATSLQGDHTTLNNFLFSVSDIWLVIDI